MNGLDFLFGCKVEARRVAFIGVSRVKGITNDDQFSTVLLVVAFFDVLDSPGLVNYS